MKNVLFICSENRLRSRTADTLWNRHPALSVRSAGTNATAVKTIRKEDVQWADVIIVMEPYHLMKLSARFPDLLGEKSIHVLDIPDIYQYMDPVLVKIMESLIPPLLDL